MAPTHGVSLYNVDAITQTIPTPLIPGNDYTIDFWTFVSNKVSPTQVTFAASNGPPIIPALIPSMPSSMTPLISIDLIPDYSWHHISATFTYTATATADQLIVLESPWALGPFPKDNYGITIGLDDIVLRPAVSSCLSIPDTICKQKIVDLNLYTCGIKGTWAWQKNSTSTSGITISYDHLFDPTKAVILKSSSDSGKTTIRFDYIDRMGCAITEWARPYIDSCILLYSDINPSIGADLFSIYPNPANGFINVRSGIPGKMIIYSMDGREIIRYEIEVHMVTKALPPTMHKGIYWVRFLGNDGTTTITRLENLPSD